MSENEFRKKVNEKLEILTNDLETVLRKLIEQDYPKEVVFISFEVFPDGFTEGFPVQTFFLDKDFTEYFIKVNGKAEYPSSVSPELLEIEYVYPYELEEEFDDDEYDLWEIATKELIIWFAQCWLNAGGKNFKLKASIIGYEGEYDLVQGKWNKTIN